MSNGWISLHRSLKDNWIWDDSKKLKWWIDILLSANYKDKKIVINNTIILIKRGSFFTSILSLSKAWDVDRKTVRKFLNLLQKDSMISLEKNTIGTMIKVTNYNEYQDNMVNTMDNGMDIILEENIYNEKEEIALTEVSESEDIPMVLEDNTAAKEACNNEEVDKIRDKTRDNSMDITMDNGVPTTIPTTNKDNNINNNKQYKKEKQSKKSNFTFEGVHKAIYDELGEVAYKTWFSTGNINIKNNTLIICNNTFELNVIKLRYLKLLENSLKMKIELKEINKFDS